jgi:hypothetical protein
MEQEYVLVVEATRVGVLTAGSMLCRGLTHSKWNTTEQDRKVALGFRIQEYSKPPKYSCVKEVRFVVGFCHPSPPNAAAISEVRDVSCK